MRILILHNNNLPFFLRDSERTQFDEMTFDSRLLRYDNNMLTMSFDSYVSSELDFLNNYNCDLIVLPFTLSEENYLEYTGLRVAVHLRLTKKWNKITTPILFLGPDSVDDVIKLSKLGNVINSYHVFHTDQNEQNKLLDCFRKIIDNYPGGDNDTYFNSASYKLFLDKLNVTPPANYSSHHSIANEWAIIRWNQMFSWTGHKPEVKNKEILDMLYFKYLIASSGTREAFSSKWKKKNIISPIIRGINGKRILYIDDEGSKGWNDLLGEIFKNSGVSFLPFPFIEDISKYDLLKSINSFIDENEADCYIVDMRLHDDDFDTDVDSKDFTGIKIAQYIKEKNIGNQVVLFTASNKMWNYEEAVGNIGVDAYLIKESPEYNYSRNDTYLNFCKFASVVKKAVERSFIADYVKLVSTCDFMEDKHKNSLLSFLELLALNEHKTLKANLLNLAVFIESYILDKFRIDGHDLIKNSEDEISNYRMRFSPYCIHFYDDFSSVKFFESETPKGANCIIIDPKKDASVIILALHYYYGLSEKECSL